MKRPWLLPLAPLYAAGAAWKNRGFDRGTARADRLRDPVISVGSLSAGGAGKTPFVIALGDALRRAGVSVDVLSRGYGRRNATEQPQRVVGTGRAEEFGDEPLLIARQLSAPVYVSAMRLQAGQMAERERAYRREAGRHAHLLDDGFQHRRLARAVDIVLLTEADVRDTWLPAGDLRESVGSLRRADIVVVRSEEADALWPVLARLFHGIAMPPFWTVQRRFIFTEGALGSRPMAFCGIARPEGFRDALRSAGVAVAGFHAFRDHHAFTLEDVRKINQMAKAAGADGFVTTAKDAVRLSPTLRAELQRTGPLAVADVAVRIDEEERLVRELLTMPAMEAAWKDAGYV